MFGLLKMVYYLLLLYLVLCVRELLRMYVILFKVLTVYFSVHAYHVVHHPDMVFKSFCTSSQGSKATGAFILTASHNPGGPHEVSISYIFFIEWIFSRPYYVEHLLVCLAATSFCTFFLHYHVMNASEEFVSKHYSCVWYILSFADFQKHSFSY